MFFADDPVTHCAFLLHFQVLSNTIKQKRKEKAGKWDVPLPKVSHALCDCEVIMNWRLATTAGF